MSILDGTPPQVVILNGAPIKQPSSASILGHCFVFLAQTEKIWEICGSLGGLTVKQLISTADDVLGLGTCIAVFDLSTSAKK